MNYKKKQNKRMILLVAIMFLAVLFSNSAYAVQLSNIQVTGSGDIEGVRHTVDITSVSVQVTNIGNDTNVMSQLTFTTPHALNVPPSNCDGGGSSYTCVYTSSQNLLKPNIYPITANYPGTTSLSAQLIADGDGPRTVSLNVNQWHEGVSAVYYIHDPEYDGTNTLTCSGIERIEFYADGELVNTVEDISDTAGKFCEWIETTWLDGDWKYVQGQHQIHIVAYDILGNSRTSETRILETDFTPPVINNTFKLLDSGEEIIYINTKNIHNDLTVLFEVIEHSDLRYVRGDLSDLNEGASYEYLSIRPVPNDGRSTCNFYSSNDKWICEFKGINVNLDTINPIVHLSIEDEKGLVVEKSLSAEFDVDNDNATLQFLGTNLTHAGISYITDGTIMFVAQLNDAGAGFRNEYANLEGYNFIFSLDGFGGSEKAYADECVQSGNIWKCHEMLEIDESEFSNGDVLFIGVHPDSQEDAGNSINVPESLDMTVVVDLLPPELLGNITYEESTTGRTEWVQAGDTIVFTAKIIEDESVIIKENALADFSNLVSDAEAYSAVPAEECVPGEVEMQYISPIEEEGGELTSNETHTVYTCRWKVENVVATESEAFDQVIFTISDIVGNTFVETEVFVWVLTVSTDENPDYLKYGILNITPAAIDRATTTFVDYGVWVPFHVEEYLQTPVGQNAVPLKVYFKECREEGEDNHVKESIVFGDVSNPGNFTAYVVFHHGNYDEIDELNVVCEFDVVSRYGSRVSNLENESVEFTVPLFNSEYDFLEDAFVKKLKSSTMFIRSWGEWIDGANDVLKTLKGLCNIGVSLTGIQRITSDVDAVMLGIATAMYAFPYTSSAANTLWDNWHNKFYCGVIDKTVNKLDYSTSVEKIGKFKEYCSYLTCSHGCWYGKGDKYKEQFDKFVTAGQEKIIDFTHINKLVDANICFGKNDASVGEVEDPCSSGAGNDLIGGKVLGLNVTGLKDIDGKKCLPSLKELGAPSLTGSMLNMDNSIIMATACMCVPKVIEGLAKMRQIECSYVKCMSEAAVMGAPYTTCEDDKKVLMCKEVWGPVIDMIPNPVKWISDMGEWIKNLIKTSPVKALGLAVSGVCDVYKKATKDAFGGIDRSDACKGSLATDIGTGKGLLVAMCGVEEAYYKWEDLKAMGENLENAGDNWWKEFLSFDEFWKSEYWSDADTNICESDDIIKLTEAIDAIE